MKIGRFIRSTPGQLLLLWSQEIEKPPPGNWWGLFRGVSRR